MFGIPVVSYSTHEVLIPVNEAKSEICSCSLEN